MKKVTKLPKTVLIGRCPTTADIFSAALLVACAMCPGVNRSIQIQVGSESYKETLELMNDDDVMPVGLGKDNPDMVPLDRIWRQYYMYFCDDPLYCEMISETIMKVVDQLTAETWGIALDATGVISHAITTTAQLNTVGININSGVVDYLIMECAFVLRNALVYYVTNPGQIILPKIMHSVPTDLYGHLEIRDPLTITESIIYADSYYPAAADTSMSNVYQRGTRYLYIWRISSDTICIGNCRIDCSNRYEYFRLPRTVDEFVDTVTEDRKLAIIKSDKISKFNDVMPDILKVLGAV